MAAEERNKLIVLTTAAGLSNRLKPILSGMRIAAKLGLDVYMHWNTSQTISPLEENIPRRPEYEAEIIQIPFEGDWRDYFAHDLPRSNHRMCIAGDVESLRDIVPQKPSGSCLLRYTHRFVRFEGEPVMDFLTHDRLAPEQRMIQREMLSHLARLAPAKHLAQRIAEFAAENEIDRHTVGLHIRRNHPHAGRISIDSFLKALENVIDERRNVFLATDSSEIEQIVRFHFGNRVVVSSKRSRARDQCAAVEDAIVDLFLLARTGYLIGSSGSSFSDLAWWLGECRAINRYVRQSQSHVSEIHKSAGERTMTKTASVAPPLNQPAAVQPAASGIRPEMHLNILLPSMILGGAERSVHDVWLGLRQRNPTGNLFLLHSGTPSYPVKDMARLRVHRLHGKTLEEKLRIVGQEVLASPTPILFTHLIRAESLRVLWGMGVVTVPVIQNASPAWQDDPRVYDHPNVPQVIAVSEAVATELRAARCSKPVTVIRHELQRWFSAEDLRANRAAIRQMFHVSDDTLLIGMVGQFKAQKAYPRAIQVLSEVRRHYQTKLMILGDGDHDFGYGRITFEATCQLAHKLGVFGDLILPGAVHPVEPYYAAFDIFLNTSIFEGLSVATLEAIQSGCPVVTADAGGNREVLPPSAALIEDPSDIAAYVEAILERAGTPRQAVPQPQRVDLVPRLWGMISQYGINNGRGGDRHRMGTLFLTSNLNPGGAQRSLTNLLCHLPDNEKAFLCILGKVHSEGFLKALEEAKMPILSLDHIPSMLDRIEKVLDLTEKLAIANLCYWNVDAETKLILTKVLETSPVKLLDVSPGPMLFHELEQAAYFQHRIGLNTEQYLDRLNYFVSKYNDGVPTGLRARCPEKVVIIPNGVSGPTHLEIPGSLPGFPEEADPAFVIGTCCRIVPSKRLDVLVEMMAHLTRLIPAVSLVVVGGVERRHIPYWDQIMARIRELGLTNIHFVGSHTNVYPYLRRFQVFVMISEDQGCPNASLEAMAAGLPVVANPNGGTCEQILEGHNGYLVEDDDPCGMADRVAWLLHNSEAASSFGKAGQERARQHFSMDLMARRYLEILS